MASHDPHLFTIDVRFSELDAYGHLNHAVYATYFETARIAALRDHDLDLIGLADAGFQFVVATLTIDFKRPATANDSLRVETVVEEIRRASSRWKQSIWRGDELLAVAEVRAGLTDTTGKPARPPDWLIERLAPLVPASTQ